MLGNGAQGFLFTLLLILSYKKRNQWSQGSRETGRPAREERRDKDSERGNGEAEVDGEDPVRITENVSKQYSTASQSVDPGE